MSRAPQGRVSERSLWTSPAVKATADYRAFFSPAIVRRRELMRRAQNKKRARELKKQFVKQLDSAEGNQRAELDAQKLTFAKVADRCEAARHTARSFPRFSR